MIEVAPRESWKVLSPEDAKLYAFSYILDGKIGWRLPYSNEVVGHHGYWSIGRGSIDTPNIDVVCGPISSLNPKMGDMWITDTHQVMCYTGNYYGNTGWIPVSNNVIASLTLLPPRLTILVRDI